MNQWIHQWMNEHTARWVRNWGDTKKLQSCQRSFPTNQCPKAIDALSTVLNFAYNRWNELNPNDKYEMFLAIDFVFGLCFVLFCVFYIQCVPTIILSVWSHWMGLVKLECFTGYVFWNSYDNYILWLYILHTKYLYHCGSGRFVPRPSKQTLRDHIATLSLSDELVGEP